MRPLFLSTFLFFFFALQGMAQSDSLSGQKRIRYFNTFQAGMLIGKENFGTTASVFTVHGIRSGTLAIGLGIGYDDYTRATVSWSFGGVTHTRWKVVPMFASFSADFLEFANSKVFLQTNAGYSIIRSSAPEPWQEASKVRGGIMINPALGLRISAGRHKLYVTAGYKWQKNHYEFDLGNWSPQTEVKETMQRFNASIGFGWN